jgi:1-aminocyclopropane-1-carboxylate deaminase
MFYFDDIESLNQEINLPSLKKYNVNIFVKREDLIHPIISGNKFRKLKYNIEKAIKDKKDEIISFGGAYSNHLLALAFIGKLSNLKTIGIIRGEELKQKKLNSTLKRCKDFGMKFIFISRNEYKKRNEIKYINSLKVKFRKAFIVPEGGTNYLGVKGCEEILNKEDSFFDVICCPVGSGGTISGLINSKNNFQKILGFSALKDSKIKNVITKFVNNNDWKVFDDMFFGGYSKVDYELVNFINKTYDQTGILFDPIYNSKMLFQIIYMISNDKWPYGKNILLINTGGIQSIDEINLRLKKKGCVIINH